MLSTLTSDEMSSILGWMSIACWIVVYSPQIWENYLLKSGEGLSVTFIVLWLLGDITNLVGGVMAKLLPTMIILALYYTVCDLVLLFQVYYYRRLAARSAAPALPDASNSHSETSPLLSASQISIPAPPAQAQPKPLLPPYLEYPLLLLFVLGAGVFAWFLSSGEPEEIGIPEKPPVQLEWRSQLLGYTSAVLYLGSRIPQIAHNYKTRCAGLSLAMFFFSISGNVTYVLSILLTSLEPRYILANASWLAGSGLTVFLDLFVLAQFAVYAYQDNKLAREGKVFADDDEEGRIDEGNA